MKAPSYLLVLLGLWLCTTAGAQEDTWSGVSLDFNHGDLKVSSNNRYLIFEDGTPFFWLGDTAWELFHRLTKSEAENYLENRREKGFTVIQAVVLPELDGLHVPNTEGELPLFNNDPTQPNEAYFQHIDWVIAKAEEKGLFIGLLPTWGDKVDKQWGLGPEIFNPQNALHYGQFIGERYKDQQNIIWINGGDRVGRPEKNDIWEALAQGIKSKDSRHLMTYHPNGAHSSSQWFHEADWLDFNMVQTSHHERSYAAYILRIKPDYNKLPTKPVLDGEPRYEHFPVNWNPELFGYFDDADVRQAAYWSIFTGAFGHTYGCHEIWQMYAPGKEPIRYARHYWYEDLDLPGAWDMIHLRKLMESRPFTERIPYNQIIKNEYMPETEYRVATRGKDYVMVYHPAGKTATLDLTLCGWPITNAWWFNCQTGAVTSIGKISADQVKDFKPETRFRGNDWVLILDNASIDFPPPASSK